MYGQQYFTHYESTVANWPIPRIDKRDLLSIHNSTYPKKVKSGVCETLTRDIFTKLLYHGWVLLHSNHTSWDELAVLSGCEMPRPDSHYIIKRKFQDETAFRDHLPERDTAIIKQVLSDVIYVAIMEFSLGNQQSAKRSQII